MLDRQLDRQSNLEDFMVKNEKWIMSDVTIRSCKTKVLSSCPTCGKAACTSCGDTLCSFCGSDLVVEDKQKDKV